MPTLETEVTAGISELGVAQMIDFIEDEFGLYVSKHEISEENFGSMRAIARFAASKQPFDVG